MPTSFQSSKVKWNYCYQFEKKVLFTQNLDDASVIYLSQYNWSVHKLPSTLTDAF